MSDLTPPSIPPAATQPTAAMAPGSAKLGLGHGGRRIDLVKLAEAQKLLIWAILGRLLLEVASFGVTGTAGPGGLSPVVLGAYLLFWLAIQIATIVLVARMARAYGFGWFGSIAGAIAIVIPCIGLILLVILNQRVIATLQRAGAKVGFMGVSAAEMNKLREGVCSGCGYDLRGLATAICPECGRVDPRA